jgi:HK97 family phage major capsid protein
MEVRSKSVEASIRPVESDDDNGEFELILSKSNRDRDGEVLLPGDWDPLPARVHIDSDHGWERGLSVPNTVGSGVPSITASGDVVVRGKYAATEHAQLVRGLVNDGHVWQASASYLTHKRGGRVTRELLNGSIVGVPANPEAVVLSSKDLSSLSAIFTEPETPPEVCNALQTSPPQKATVMSAPIPKNLDAIAQEMRTIETDIVSKSLSAEETDAARTRWSELDVASKNLSAARRFAGSADSAVQASGEPPTAFGAPPTQQFPAAATAEPVFDAPPDTYAKRKWIAPNPCYLPEDAMRQLFDAGKQRQSFGMRLDVPGVDPSQILADGHQFTSKDMMHHPLAVAKDLVRRATSKWTTPNSAFEGAVGSMIPPELLSTAFPLRIEPVRLFELFPGAAAGGQAVTFLQHTANSASAAAVSEGAQKPDLGPTIAPTTVGFTLLAGMMSVSRQFYDDFPAWAAFAPAELYRAIVDAENSQILTGNGSSPNMLGLLNQPGTLTRAANLGGTGATSITEIDVLRSAVLDLRQGPAYCVADLIVLNTEDWDMIQKLKNTLGSYILDANNPNSIGGLDSIFGTRVVATSKMTQGKALVMDTRIACLAWTRLGMEIMANQFDTASWQSNLWSFRGEERIAVGIQYPKAINIVSGLNPGGIS